MLSRPGSANKSFGKATQNAKAKVVRSIKEVVVDDGEDMDEEME